MPGRELYVGALSEYVQEGGEAVYGYTLAEGFGEDSLASCADFRAVESALAKNFQLRPLRAIPNSEAQLKLLLDCEVASYDASSNTEYEVYTPGVAFGTVRVLSAETFAQAGENSSLESDDILILERAPLDITWPFSAVVTGTRQGALSHLNLRSAARRSPNCYHAAAHSLLEEWQGQLARLECSRNGLLVRAATAQEALEFREAEKPPKVAIPTPRLEVTELLAFAETPTKTAEERALAMRAFGAKGTNLATLSALISKDLTNPGFLIPFSFYQRFIEEQGWLVDLGKGEQFHTFSETLTELLADQEFLNDTPYRQQVLNRLEAAMRASDCNSEDLDNIGQKVVQVFGDDSLMVRFRSSSNAEDGLYFNGAGLYESTSACLSDGLSGGGKRPSDCDPATNKDRTICRGLKKVWASLFSVQAYEERAWFGIDQSLAKMGILVNPRTQNEQASLVAFTGNPVSGDSRFLVNSQTGELSVVSSEPGVVPAQDLLTISGGEVVDISRLSSSSELPETENVMTESTLRELGTELSLIKELFPVDRPPPEGSKLFLDTEWKHTSDGRLIVKQIRPFLFRAN